MPAWKKNDKEHYGLTQGSQIFANCQEEIMACQAQYREIQHEKWHALLGPGSRKSFLLNVLRMQELNLSQCQTHPHAAHGCLLLYIYIWGKLYIYTCWKLLFTEYIIKVGDTESFPLDCRRWIEATNAFSYLLSGLGHKAVYQVSRWSSLKSYEAWPTESTISYI